MVQKTNRTYSSGIELRLKVLRAFLDLSREEMADCLKINLNTYSAYENENNIRTVSDKHLENIFINIKDKVGKEEELDKDWLFYGIKNIITIKQNTIALGLSKAYRLQMVMRDLGVSVAEVARDLYMTEKSLNNLLIDEFGTIKSFKTNHKKEAEIKAEDEINNLDEETRIKRGLKKKRRQRKVLESNMISWSNTFLQNAFINYFGLNARWFETGEGEKYCENTIAKSFSEEDDLRKELHGRILMIAQHMNIAFPNKPYSLNMLLNLSDWKFTNLDWLLTGCNNFNFTSEDMDNLYYKSNAPLALPECDMPIPPNLWIIVNKRWVYVTKNQIVLPILPPNSAVNRTSTTEKIGIKNLRKRIVSYLEMCSYSNDLIAAKLGIAKSKIELWQKIEIMPPLTLLIRLSKEDGLNLHWLITGLTSPDNRYGIYDFFRTVDNPPTEP